MCGSRTLFQRPVPMMPIALGEQAHKFKVSELGSNFGVRDADERSLRHVIVGGSSTRRIANVGRSGEVHSNSGFAGSELRRPSKRFYFRWEEQEYAVRASE